MLFHLHEIVYPDSHDILVAPVLNIVDFTLYIYIEVVWICVWKIVCVCVLSVYLYGYKVSTKHIIDQNIIETTKL